MRPFAAFVLLSFALPAAAVEKEDVRKAVEQSLRSLTDDALTWKENRKCASCHHVPMTVWTLNEAKRRGFAVDEKAVADLSAWLLAKDDPAKVLLRPVPPKMTVDFSPSAVFAALGLEAGEPKDAATRDGLKAALAPIAGTQSKDGAWQLQYEWHPINSTPEVMTALTLLALTHPAAPDLGADGKAARDRGVKWLAAAAVGDDPQALALRVMLAKRLNQDAEPLAKKLLALQAADGGWKATKDLPSDAFSTGQALYALAEAGRKPDDAAVTKAVAYLLKTRNEFGVWDLKSRPGQPNGKPAKNEAVISYAGSAWATLGLIRCTPPAKP